MPYTTKKVKHLGYVFDREADLIGPDGEQVAVVRDDVPGLTEFLADCLNARDGDEAAQLRVGRALTAVYVQGGFPSDA